MVISFIGKCNILVTNSYDVATFDDFEKKIKATTKYSGALEECMEININFSEKVFNYLNIQF